MTPPRKVTLFPYDPAWPARFERHAAAILRACRPSVTEIHHIGSTSIPGLAAKPIIDIMPGLASFEAGFNCVEPMQCLGYEYRGEFGIPRRHFFTTNTPGAEQNVHMYAIGEGQWHWHLALRDHLRANPADRDRYYRLKEELAVRHAWDVEAYAIAKGEFIRSIVGRYVDLSPER